MRRVIVVLVVILASLGTAGVAAATFTATAKPPSVGSVLPGNPTFEQPSSRPTYLSRSAIELSIRSKIGAPLSATTYSAMMSESTFESTAAARPLAAGGPRNPSRMMWVVTVQAPVLTDGSPSTPPELKKSYSAVLDAETGFLVSDCVGCAWLSASK